MGFLGVNFLYSQEVITTRYRAPASGISTATHWLSAFVIVCKRISAPELYRADCQ